MKTTFCLSCTCGSRETKELAVSDAVDLGMLGCEEVGEEGAIKLKIYFPDERTAGLAEQNFRERFQGSAPTVLPVPEDDWNRKWKEHMEPALLADGVWASPQWLPPEIAEGELWIKIEPKMAFGTGHHESTKLAARGMMYLRNAFAGKNFLDVGAGSGILCFLAAYLGAARAVGVEKDLECFQNIIENRQLNNGDTAGRFLMGTLEALLQRPFFDVITINMIRTRSLPLIARCGRVIRPGGYCLWSGLLVEEGAEAKDHAERQGWRMIKESTMNGWWCGMMRKSG